MKNQQIQDFAKKLHSYLSENEMKTKKILLLSHENADVDALSCVIGVYYLLKKFFGFKDENLLVYLPELNQSATNICELLHLDEQIPITKNIHGIMDEIDQIIITDSNNPARFNEISEDFSASLPLIIIDHHQNQQESNEILDNEVNPDLIITLSYIDPKASSCAEIITAIWREWNKNSIQNFDNFKISNKDMIEEELVAQILLLGIMSDSARLKYSDNSVLKEVQFTLDKGAELKKVRELNVYHINKQERIAKIKGAIRSGEPILIGNWIVLITNVNAYEGAVCRSLIDLGADVAFCISTRKKNYRLIVRASDKFQLESSLDFGEFMEELSLELGCNGGGHIGAAGLTGQNPPDDLKKIVITKLRKKLNKINSKSS